MMLLAILTPTVELVTIIFIFSLEVLIKNIVIYLRNNNFPTVAKVMDVDMFKFIVYVCVNSYQ